MEILRRLVQHNGVAREKFVVFSMFVAYLDYLHEAMEHDVHCKSIEMTPIRIKGSTPAHERVNRLRQFARSDYRRPLFITPGTGKVVHI